MKYPFVPGEAEAFEQAWRALSTKQRAGIPKDHVRMGWMLASAARQQTEAEDVKAAVQGEHVFVRYGIDPDAREQPDGYDHKLGVYTKAVLALDLRLVIPTDQSLPDITSYVKEALDQWSDQTPPGDWWRDIEVLTVTPTDVTK
jgi:hypothetical protein